MSQWATEKTAAIGAEKKMLLAQRAPAIVIDEKIETSANHHDYDPDRESVHVIVEEIVEILEIAIAIRGIGGIVREIEDSEIDTEGSVKGAGVGIGSVVMIVAEICYLIHSIQFVGSCGSTTAVQIIDFIHPKM